MFFFLFYFYEWNSMFTHISFLSEIIKNICMAFNFNVHMSYNLKSRLILFNIIIIRKKVDCNAYLHYIWNNAIQVSPNFLFIIVVLCGFLLDIFSSAEKQYNWKENKYGINLTSQHPFHQKTCTMPICVCILNNQEILSTLQEVSSSL